MAEDMRTERLLANVELVRSRGDPQTGKLCLMSLVARLAAEPHSDHPQAASPAIGAFARAINDAMDRHTRQRLLPFAPRIAGTHAALDGDRRVHLHRVLVAELLPNLATDLQVAAVSETDATAAETTARLVAEVRARPESEQGRVVQDPRWDGAALIGPLRAAYLAHRDGHSEQHAESVARILIAGAYRVARPSRRTWYWDRAVAALDGMCDLDPRPGPRASESAHARAGTAQDQAG